MGKIVNGVANDFEFDANDYNMFPPNVEKIIITKENYKRLFKDLQEENMYLRDKVEQLQDKIDSAINYIEKIRDNTPSSQRKDIARMILLREDMLLDILKGE